jgi:hypothetical protein
LKAKLDEATGRLTELTGRHDLTLAELMRLRELTVSLTAEAAKYRAESDMKDRHIQLLQVNHAQFKEHALNSFPARSAPSAAASASISRVMYLSPPDVRSRARARVTRHR